MITARNTIPSEYIQRIRNEADMQNHDFYKYAGHVPTEYANLKDDVSEILEHCRDLGFNYYPYGGGVLQIQPEAYAFAFIRYFISFTTTNDGRQHFHEASGTNMVINATTTENPLETFLSLMKEAVTPKVGT